MMSQNCIGSDYGDGRAWHDMDTSPMNDEDKLDILVRNSSCVQYDEFLIGIYSNNCDTDFKTFGSDPSLMFPILSRIAIRMMDGSACSMDIERLFSKTGIIFSPFRRNLKFISLHFLY
jgi:hypothetical protein